MDNLYCSITGGQPNAMIKLILRLLFFGILAFVKVSFGDGWALIIAAVVIVSDLDAIESAIKRKFGKDC